MSTTTDPTATTNETPESTSDASAAGDATEPSVSDDATEPSKAERLAAFLRDEAADGETYFKAKFIADDVGLSPKEIGALIVQLQGSMQDLEIEKWSYTGATTWRVTSQ